LKALLEYQVALSQKKYPTRLIIPILEKRYEYLVSLIQNNEDDKIIKFTQSLHDLTEILVYANELDIELKEIENSYSDRTFINGTKVSSCVSDIIAPFIFDYDHLLEMDEEDCNNLTQCLRAAKYAVEYKKNNKAGLYVLALFNSAEILEKKTVGWERLADALAMLAGSVAVDHHLLDAISPGNQDALKKHLKPGQGEELFMYFKSFDKTKYQLLDLALHAMLEYHQCFTKYKFSDDAVATLLEKKCLNLKNILDDNEKIKKFTLSLNYLTEINTHLMELFDLLEIKKKYPSGKDVFDKGKGMFHTINGMITPFFSDPLFNVDEEKYKEMVVCLQYAKYCVRFQGTEKANFYISALFNKADKYNGKSSDWKRIAGVVTLLAGALVITLCTAGIIPAAVLAAKVSLYSISSLATLGGFGLFVMGSRRKLARSAYQLATACHKIRPTVMLPIESQIDKKEGETNLTSLSQAEIKEIKTETTAYYLPSKVNTADLKENKNLYSADEQAQIKSFNLPIGIRIKKYKLIKLGLKDARWDIIRTDSDTYYSIYRGRRQNCHLGAGGYAVVKIAQSFSNEYVADKIIKEAKPSADAEVGILKVANQFIFDLYRKNKRGENQNEILMKLAPGVSLNDFSSTNRNMAATHWLDVCISTIDSVDQLHQNNIVHGDLKRHNCLIHAQTSAVRQIDFGLSVYLTKDQQSVYVEQNKFGSNAIYYMAPECADGVYSYQSDVFGLGIMLAEILGLGYWPEKGNVNIFIMYSPERITPKNRLQSKEVTDNARAFIMTMLNAKPESRLTVAEAKQFFKNLRQNYKNPQGLIKHIGYLDLHHYHTCTTDIRAMMDEELRNKDEVYIIHYKNYDIPAYQQKFETKHIITMPDVIETTEENSKDRIIKHMQERCGNQAELYDFEYFNKAHILGEKLSVDQHKDVKHERRLVR